jgi:hypothetical protein
VDLNRNFVDWSGPLPSNPDYDRIAALLVPEDWSEETRTRTTDGLLTVADEWGFERMQAVVSGGQYAPPTGLFYGGAGPVWSHRWLRGWAAEALTAAERLRIVDLHTGLGPWGVGELITSVAAASQLAPGAEVTGVGLEFGTVDPVVVLQALRADAWLHAHGEPRGPDGDRVREQLRAAFADDAPAWIAACWERFTAVMGAALSG